MTDFEQIVTTEVFEKGFTGRIKMILHEPASSSDHLTFVDLIVVGEQTAVRLDRVDVDKLIHIGQMAERAAGRPITGRMNPQGSYTYWCPECGDPVDIRTADPC